MSNLRWVERDGKMILQQYGEPSGLGMWLDVPVEKGALTIENQLALEFKKECQRTNWPMPVNNDALAQVAIKFFKDRMPKSPEEPHPFFGAYNNALREISKAMFGVSHE